MSQENVEMVRNVTEAFNRGGAEATFRRVSPEFVWDASPTGIPGLGVYRGLDEIKTFFEEDWFTAFPFEEWEMEVEELIDHGDQVIVKSCQRGRGAGSGAAVEIHFAQVWTFRNGKLVRITNYMTYDEALEAAGVRE